MSKESKANFSYLKPKLIVVICPTFPNLQAWPANAKVEAWKMAKAGFRYTGQEEEVACLSFEDN